MSKLYSLGELLIDFQSVGTGSLKDTAQFIKKAGGAPANVCVQAVKLGLGAVYLTKVGADGFGDFLIESLANEGVDVSHISRTSLYDTSLAFVSFKEGGEREFSFYRKAAADLHFTKEDFAAVNFARGDFFEFGSVALASEEARDTHLYLIEKAKAAGAVVCFDPNLRFNLWNDRDELKEIVNKFAAYADVMKVGDDELTFITGLPLKEGAEKLLEKGVKALLITKGGDGAEVILADGKRYYCAGYKVKTVDTTGAGDSCFGAFIYGLSEAGASPENLPDIEYKEILDFACKCGAYTTTGFGAIAAMGDKKSVEKAVK